MSNQGELVTSDGAALVPSNGLNVAQLMAQTLEQLSGPGKAEAVAAMKELAELHLRLEAVNAAKAFNKAFATFQETVKRIPRSKHVSIQGGAKWDYAPLEEIEPKIRPTLKAVGLSYRFTNVEPNEKGSVRIRCTLMHLDGHSEYAEFEGPPDDKVKVSSLHKAGIADTYAKRRALTSVLGLVTCDPKDTDGVSPEALESITPQQVTIISKLIADTSTDEETFLNWVSKLAKAEIATLDDIPQGHYQDIIDKLEQKARRLNETS
jgi:hypothetical protein